MEIYRADKRKLDTAFYDVWLCTLNCRAPAPATAPHAFAPNPPPSVAGSSRLAALLPLARRRAAREGGAAGGTATRTGGASLSLPKATSTSAKPRAARGSSDTPPPEGPEPPWLAPATSTRRSTALPRLPPPDHGDITSASDAARLDTPSSPDTPGGSRRRAELLELNAPVADTDKASALDGSACRSLRTTRCDPGAATLRTAP